MPLLPLAILLALLPATAAPQPFFAVLADDPGPWPNILAAAGFQQKPAALARIFVTRTGAGATPAWTARVEAGACLILEGTSPLAEMFGFRPRNENVRAAGMRDEHNPELPIIWRTELDLPVYQLPENARVFARERWALSGPGAPLMAGLRRGSGAVLWLAAPPGEHGYERFPYILQALADLGLEPPFRSNRLWAFFDSSYRARVDLDYFAARWRQTGIAALHVAAWHSFEPDPQGDQYLQRLIAACHRQGILVYAWLELPHVSERFWQDHPQWREKTALLQDAQLDWRKLMNLTNRDCFRAVQTGVKDLISRFDWDGVNLAELYFESLEGAANPSRFTPMNDDVRRLYREQHGADPITSFQTRTFLDFRAALARRTQEEWLAVLDEVRKTSPHLDVVLTHVDDRLDTKMRDAIGADAAALLPALDRRSMTFLIEDPATVWHLDAQRYRTMAARYRGLTTRPEKLAIDLNIVERYQDVYPTRQQTGVELFQLVHAAASSFPRVGLYFEKSILRPDLPLLASAAAAVTEVDRIGSKLTIKSPAGVGVRWEGGALIDGQMWPVQDDRTVWAPAGSHSIESSAEPPQVRITHFNGDLRSARVLGGSAVEVAYASAARAFAVLDRKPVSLELDGDPADLRLAGPYTVMIPRGQHVVTIRVE